MAYIKFGDLKIGDKDDDGKSVLISELDDRPNSFNSYRESKMNASALKSAFDRSFLLVKKRFNDLLEKLKLFEGYVKVGFEEQNERIDGLLQAEDERVEAENERVEAENERVEAENERKERMNGRIGKGGSTTLLSNKWSASNEQEITVPNVGEYDLVMFYPATESDRAIASVHGLFIKPNSNSGNFIVSVNAVPQSDISLKYYIIFGRLPENGEVE